MLRPYRPPPQPYVFRSKRLKLLCDLFMVGAVFVLFAFSGLVTSWAGHRPLAPNPATGQVIPYSNHGVMFVSQRDVDAAHLLLAICLGCGLAAFGCYLVDHRPWRRPSL